VPAALQVDRDDAIERLCDEVRDDYLLSIKKVRPLVSCWVHT